MNNNEQEALLKEVLGENDILILKSVQAVNYKPHQYMIGARHVKHASDNFGGMLGEQTLKAVQCAHPGCAVPYEEHTYDTVAFLQLKRNCTNDEIKPLMLVMSQKIEETKCGVDGFVFVDTPEKFRINE